MRSRPRASCPQRTPSPAKKGNPVPPETSIDLEIALPEPGIYEFVYTDPRDQWRFEIVPDVPETPIAFPVRRGAIAGRKM